MTTAQQDQAIGRGHSGNAARNDAPPSAPVKRSAQESFEGMIGAEDRIADALFGFTRPACGAYFGCPPMHQGRLVLRALGR
jgi:porphyrinogen peroxidase